MINFNKLNRAMAIAVIGAAGVGCGVIVTKELTTNLSNAKTHRASLIAQGVNPDKYVTKGLLSSNGIYSNIKESAKNLKAADDSVKTARLLDSLKINPEAQGRILKLVGRFR